MATARARTVTIANGATTSDRLKLNGATLVGVGLPAAFTGTALSFLVSADDITYRALTDTTGATVSATTAASKAFSIDPALMLGWEYVKVVSNAAEGGARAVTLVSRIVE